MEYGSGKVVRIKMRRPCSWEGARQMEEDVSTLLGGSEEQLPDRAREGSPGKEARYTSVYIK